jgi:hypothetical protein
MGTVEWLLVLFVFYLFLKFPQGTVELVRESVVKAQDAKTFLTLFAQRQIRRVHDTLSSWGVLEARETEVELVARRDLPPIRRTFGRTHK